MILAIDPGSEQSAYVLYDEHADAVVAHAKAGNGRVLAQLLGDTNGSNLHADRLAVEMVASYGMAVGKEVFSTCVWIGRFIQAWEQAQRRRWQLVYRLDCKMHLCHDSRAKDPNIRRALIDRFGGQEAAVGRKAAPGPLFGISGDRWSALAVAITAAEAGA